MPIKLVLDSTGKLRRLPTLRLLLPVRFLKFATVGGLGVVVNLTSMALLIRFIGWRDWRASASATLVAILHNYALNNTWTFYDRRRTGSSFYSGYLLYLLVSMVGLAVTSSVYTGLTHVLPTLVHQAPNTLVLAVPHLLACQFLAILFGVVVNYALNAAITWRSRRGPFRDPGDNPPTKGIERSHSRCVPESPVRARS